MARRENLGLVLCARSAAAPPPGQLPLVRWPFVSDQWSALFARCRSEGEEPADFLAGTPDPRTWPTPYAAFPTQANCASTHFEDMQLVFDLTFCGGFAGNTYDDTCGDQPAACKTCKVRDTGAAAECWTAVAAAQAMLQDRTQTPPRDFGGCLNADSTVREIQVSCCLREIYGRVQALRPPPPPPSPPFHTCLIVGQERVASESDPAGIPGRPLRDPQGQLPEAVRHRLDIGLPAVCRRP